MPKATGKQKPIRVVHVGLGPIGAGVVQRLARHPGVQIVGAVDPDPQKAGKSLAEHTGAQISDQIKVSPNLAAALADQEADIAVHCTSSFLDRVTPQLLELIDSGLNVISTTEELSYPWYHHPEAARAIDDAANRKGVTVLGTGINPGFVMDVLPMAITSMCQDVSAVRVRRTVDAGKRRLPLQRKVGAGISEAEFHEKAAGGTFGHIGLVESVAMLAASLNWSLERIDQKLLPVVNDGVLPVNERAAHIRPGAVLGIDHTAHGFAGGVEVVTLKLRMYVGATEPIDSVTIDGNPPIEMSVPGGIHGDVATVAAVANNVPKVVASRPGLLTMKDLSVPVCWPGDR